MTDDIDNMGAGAALDALVATKVMGWPAGIVANACRVCQTEKTFHYGDSQLWSPSTDIAHAWQVVEKMKELLSDELTFDIMIFKDGQCGAGIVDEYGDWKYDMHSCGETAPLAICRAALKAIRS